MNKKYIIDQFFIRYNYLLNASLSNKEEVKSFLIFLLDLEIEKQPKYINIISVVFSCKSEEESVAILSKIKSLQIEEKEAKDHFKRKYNFDSRPIEGYLELSHVDAENLSEYRKRGFISRNQLGLLSDMISARDYFHRFIKVEDTVSCSSNLHDISVFFELGVYYLKTRRIPKLLGTDVVFCIWLVYMLKGADEHTRRFIYSKDSNALFLTYKNYVGINGGVSWAFKSMKRLITIKDL